jgi:hypothetical protein
MTMPPRSYIRPVLVNESSPFLGDDCALCKEPFVDGDKLVICPQDGSRHHQACWEANGNHCTAFGCEGQGEVVEGNQRVVARAPRQSNGEAKALGRFSKVRTMPSSSMGCAQSCLVLSIALAIILIAAGCFGLWAVADYILIEVLGWQYRAPFTGAITPISFTAFLTALQTLSPL